MASSAVKAILNYDFISFNGVQLLTNLCQIFDTLRFFIFFSHIWIFFSYIKNAVIFEVLVDVCLKWSV